jgi:hypothetical protein
VITVPLHASLYGFTPVEWQPPTPEAVLTAHLRRLVGDSVRERELLGLRYTQDFLAGQHHQLREAAAFADRLAAYSRGERGLDELRDFSTAALTGQVQEWFQDEEIPLRDKAFLVALAAFNEAPYALAAELSDKLFIALHRSEDGGTYARVPVFGTSIDNRLKLARATGYEEEESTEWGPVNQFKARFLEPRAAGVLLREVWTAYPSARPALVAWLRQLTDDGRPLVRTRAALTAAILAFADLPSAMALLVEGWADAKRYRSRLVAANALALAHALGTPNIPRILRSWCGKEQSERLRWTAIRAYALAGPDMVEEALAVLTDTARDGNGEEEAKQIADSVALLLTASSVEVRTRVLADLAALVYGKPPVRWMALRAFVLACEHDQDLLLLRWYAEAAAGDGTEDDRHLVALWRAGLNDLAHTADALKVLRRWIHAADDDATAEGALAAMLPAVAVTGEDRKRLSHLLRTTRGERGEQPAVADRLLASL